ncbi:hypothetical protein EHYA_06888 [Embleya hyalina]|uniref:Uncharacterized protein n=1 Tax=Embleya hyalina TaxID=516124 RepID=A0A401YXC3_9ACTN|nr:hypothetical protein EHYA_06888 [Embleya hyalina]
MPDPVLDPRATTAATARSVMALENTPNTGKDHS